MISQSLCVNALSSWKLQQVKLSLQARERIVLGVSWGCNDKTSTVCHQWTRRSLPSKHGSIAATDGIGWDKQACWHNTFPDVTVTVTWRLAKNV